MRSFETCVCWLFLSGVFSICAMLSHQREIIAGCQSALYWESRGKRVYDTRQDSECVCPVLLSSGVSPFTSATPPKCSPRVWSCQRCSFPGNQSHTSGQISAHVEINSNGATHVPTSNKGKHNKHFSNGKYLAFCFGYNTL